MHNITVKEFCDKFLSDEKCKASKELKYFITKRVTMRGGSEDYKYFKDYEDDVKKYGSIAEYKTMKEVWDKCQHPHRLLLIAEKLGLTEGREKELTGLACRFARETPALFDDTVWGLLEDERSKKAVETREKWLRGEVTDSELEKAYKDAVLAVAACDSRSATRSAERTKEALQPDASYSDARHSAASYASEMAVFAVLAARAAANVACADSLARIAYETARATCNIIGSDSCLPEKARRFQIPLVKELFGDPFKKPEDIEKLINMGASLKELALEKQATRELEAKIEENKRSLRCIKEIEELIPRLVRETVLALENNTVPEKSLASLILRTSDECSKHFVEGEDCDKIEAMKEVRSLLSDAAEYVVDDDHFGYGWEGEFNKVTPEFAEIVDKLSECLDEKGHLKGVEIEKYKKS